jgi:ABC-type amino acid transport substrate-binding protein
MNNNFDPVAPGRSRNRFSVAIALALLSLLISGYVLIRDRQAPPARGFDSRWTRIKRAGVLRVGYGGYPPYTIVSSDTGKAAQPVTGFSVDLVNAIAGKTAPPLKVEWYQYSFDTMKADLEADRFDFIADPVFMGTYIVNSLGRERRKR